MTLPTVNLGMSNINNELRYGQNRQTSISEYFINVLEHDQPVDVQWSRLRNQTSSYTLDIRSDAIYGGLIFGGPGAAISIDINNYYNYYLPSDIFSIDLMMYGWGGSMQIMRVFFTTGSGFIGSWLVPNFTKRHTHVLSVSGSIISAYFAYSGQKTDTFRQLAKNGFGKLNYWAPGTATPGAAANLGADWSAYAAQYYNNIS